jgi:hypothetical protein
MRGSAKRAVEHLRSALDELVRIGGEGAGLAAHQEQAALRIRQALELLEGAGPGGFDPVA